MSSVKRLCYCVNNEWRTSATDRYTPVMNPSTGRQIAEAPVCLPDEVESAVQAAKAAYPAWAGKPVGVRTQILFRFRELVNRHFELAPPSPRHRVLVATEDGEVVGLLGLAPTQGLVLKAQSLQKEKCRLDFKGSGFVP